MTLLKDLRAQPRTEISNWRPGERLLESPVLALPTRVVGEDEFREWGSIAAATPAGDNLIFVGRREKVDIEILEVVLQNQSTSTITAQLHASGSILGSQWQVAAAQFWSEAGFILMNGQQLYLRTQAAGAWAFEIRWRLYYGRKK